MSLHGNLVLPTHRLCKGLDQHMLTSSPQSVFQDCTKTEKLHKVRSVLQGGYPFFYVIIHFYGGRGISGRKAVEIL